MHVRSDLTRLLMCDRLILTKLKHVKAPITRIADSWLVTLAHYLPLLRLNNLPNTFGHWPHWCLRVCRHLHCCLPVWTALCWLRELLVEYVFWHWVSWWLIEGHGLLCLSPCLVGTLLSLCLFLFLVTLPLSHPCLSVFLMNPLPVRRFTSSTYVPRELNSAALISIFSNTRLISLCSFLTVLQIKIVRI